METEAESDGQTNAELVTVVVRPPSPPPAAQSGLLGSPSQSNRQHLRRRSPSPSRLCMVDMQLYDIDDDDDK
jgi:hypothetical protein